MTNEEKAIEITLRNGAYDAALEMAEWKDEQFSKEKNEFIDKACEWWEKELC